MLSVVSTALSIGGAISSTSTSWLSIVAALVILSLLWAYEGRITAAVRARIDNITINSILGRRVTRIAIQLIVGFVIIWGAVISANMSILEPNIFLGYTEQPPLRFGRYVASIAPSGAVNPYCPEAQVMGDVVNTTRDRLMVWYQGDPIRVWTLSPSVVFNGTALIGGISPANGGHTNIEPGSSIPLTITARMTDGQCKDYVETSLNHLRRGRMNVTTSIHITNARDGGTSLQPIRFHDLPIALGD